jgi:hypothetical protein
MDSFVAERIDDAIRQFLDALRDTPDMTARQYIDTMR